MTMRSRRTVQCASAILCAAGVWIATRSDAQVRPTPPHEQLPLLQPVYDGWYKNPDGTQTFSYGYINRTEKPIELPVGPNNGFAPGQADRGQPKVFQPGTERNAVLVIVPGNFTQNLVW